MKGQLQMRQRTGLHVDRHAVSANLLGQLHAVEPALIRMDLGEPKSTCARASMLP